MSGIDLSKFNEIHSFYEETGKDIESVSEKYKEMNNAQLTALVNSKGAWRNYHNEIKKTNTTIGRLKTGFVGFGKTFLSTLGSMAISMAVSAAIAGLFKLGTLIITYYSRQQEAAQKDAEAHKELSDEIDNYKNRVKELRKELATGISSPIGEKRLKITNK